MNNQWEKNSQILLAYEAHFHNGVRDEKPYKGYF